MGIGDEFEEKFLSLSRISLAYRPQKGNFAPFLNLTGTLEQNSFGALTTKIHMSLLPFDYKPQTYPIKCN